MGFNYVYNQIKIEQLINLFGKKFASGAMNNKKRPI